MKKKLLTLLSLAFILCMSLTACLVVTPPDNEEEEGPTTSDMTLMKIIVPEEANYPYHLGIDYEAIREAYQASPAETLLYMYGDTDEAPGDSELVIGETNRPITATAKAALEAEIAKANNDDQIGYVFYCDGKSLAMYWDDQFTYKLAHAYLMTEIIEKGLDAFPEGAFKLETMDKSDAKKAQEAIDRENDFAKVAELYGQDVSDALRSHYDLYDERFYIWISNLYDPGVGGFYYSNSGLATQGYLPDVESTQQAISFYQNAGMFRAYRLGVKDAIPTWMQEQMINFARELQDPEDGYFYHPQWGKNITASRLSRDLGWAITIVTQFDGGKIKWNAPNGRKGEFGAPPGATAMTGQLVGDSAVVATSCVAAAIANGNYSVLDLTAATDEQKEAEYNRLVKAYPKRLRSIEDFRYYLIVEKNGSPSVDDIEPRNIRSKSYSIGNEVASQTGQISERDALDVKYGKLPDANKDGIADGGYIETFRDLFNYWQLDYNGVWEHSRSIDPVTGKAVEDPDGEVYYNATNGLMKISGGYNSLNIEIPNAYEALESAIYMINYVEKDSSGNPGKDIMGKQPNGSVDVYNPWVCVGNLLTNLKKHHGESAAEQFRQTLRPQAAEMIRNTTIKTRNFEKEDGSFGYTWNYSPAKSQSAPVAVPNTVEGDINGGCIACTGITRSMCTALGVSMIPIFRDSDWDVCLDIFANATPVLKDPIVAAEAEVRDFEEETLGAQNGDIDSVSNYTMNTGYLEVAPSPAVSDKGYGNGQVLKFVALETEKGDTAKFAVGGGGETCYTLEFDIYMDEYSLGGTKNGNGTLLQISLGSSYRVEVVSTGGMLKLQDNSTTSTGNVITNLGIYFKPQEWHRVRVEYYPSTADQVRTKVFFDGQLRAVSTNYIGNNSTLVVPASPATKYTEATFYSLNPCVQTVYFDNVLAEKGDGKYVEEEVISPYLVKDFESEDSEFNNKFGSATVVADPEDDDNHALHVGSSTNVSLSASGLSPAPNCYANEFRLYVPKGTTGEQFRMYYGTQATADAVAAWAFVVESRKLSIYEVRLEGGSEVLGDEPIVDGISIGEWTDVRIEYYRYQFDQSYSGCASIIYVDGDAEGYGTAYYEINNMKKDFSYALYKSATGCDFYLDDVMPTKESILFVNEDGDEVADPGYAFPSGGASVTNEAGAGHTGIFNFEDSALGLPTAPGITTKVEAGTFGNKMEVVADPTGAGRGNVLHVNLLKSANGSSSAYTYSKVNTSGNCYVAEFDIYFEKLEAERTQQLYFKSGDKTVACFNISYTDNGDGTFMMKIWEKTEKSTDTATIVDNVLIEGWTTFRVEYYTDNHVMKFYVNDESVAECAKYYNEANKNLAVDTFSISGVRNLQTSYYLDDLTFEKIQKAYN